MERRLLKDFHIGIVEGIVNEISQNPIEPKNVFGQIAKVIGRRTTFKSKKKDWNALVRKNTMANDPIGTAQEAEESKRKRQSIRKHILANVEHPVQIEDDKLLEYNPQLSEVPRTARLAYAKFMTKKIQKDFTENVEVPNNTIVSSKSSKKESKKPPRQTSVTFRGSTPEPPVVSYISSDVLPPKNVQNPMKTPASDDSFTAPEKSDATPKIRESLKLIITPEPEKIPTPLEISKSPSPDHLRTSTPTPALPKAAEGLIPTPVEKTDRIQDSAEKSSPKTGSLIEKSDNTSKSQESSTSDNAAPPQSLRSKLTGQKRTGWI